MNFKKLLLIIVLSSSCAIAFAQNPLIGKWKLDSTYVGSWKGKNTNSSDIYSFKKNGTLKTKTRGTDFIKFKCDSVCKIFHHTDSIQHIQTRISYVVLDGKPRKMDDELSNVKIKYIKSTYQYSLKADSIYFTSKSRESCAFKYSYSNDKIRIETQFPEILNPPSKVMEKTLKRKRTRVL